MIALLAYLLIIGCVLNPPQDHPRIPPVPTPSDRPTLPPPLPPFVTPTPTPPPVREVVIESPGVVEQCKPFVIAVRGPYKKDDLVIWAEKRFHIGRMFFDAEGDRKYLGVKLNTPGPRVLHIKLNGEWAFTVNINVNAAPDNCM